MSRKHFQCSAYLARDFHLLVRTNHEFDIILPLHFAAMTQAADEHGVTLIGFAREHRMNVYTHSERIKVD